MLGATNVAIPGRPPLYHPTITIKESYICYGLLMHDLQINIPIAKASMLTVR